MISVVLAILVLTTIVPQERVEASTKDSIVSIARDQLGTPYRFGGTTPSGFDCSGFIGYVFNKVGVDLPRTAAAQYGAGQAVSRSNLEVGDLVFFETYKPGPSHSGIYIGNNQFIHASSSRGISISSVNDPYYWSDRYLGARRVLKEEVKAEPEIQQVSLKQLPAGQYHDVPSSFWAKKEIATLGEANIINGYDTSIFKPSNPVTRAQVAIILSRALDLKPTGQAKGFNDVSSKFHAYDEIQAVADAGLFSGDSNGNFKPNDPFTREHIALVFAKAFELEAASETIHFSDIDESRNSYEAIQRLAASGITGGLDDGSYGPGNTTTRAQLAVFLHRALY